MLLSVITITRVMRYPKHLLFWIPNNHLAPTPTKNYQDAE